MKPRRKRCTGLLAATGIFLMLVVIEHSFTQEVWSVYWELAVALGLCSAGGTSITGGQTLTSPPLWYDIVTECFFYVVCAAFVPLWLAIWAYHHIARRPPPSDGHTHCGKCGYILNGLTEPRCPECGQAI